MKRSFRQQTRVKGLERASSQPRWKPSVETSWEATRRETGQNFGVKMINCFQSLSCADPGVYKGKPSENFKEFLRRFRRKYQRVVCSEQTLIETLGDDHLGGRAKSIFLTIKVEVKRKGFNIVVTELGNL